MQITALSETRLAEEGQLAEQFADDTFFWDWMWTRATAGRSWLAIKNNLVNMLAARLNRINSPQEEFATMFSAYTPTMTNLDEMKARFYED